MSFLRTSIYVKNVPGWERALRVAAALGGAVLAGAFLPLPMRWVGVVAALSFGLTGVVGFCPMCALVGRRLAKSE
jgi:hypothetical protein